MNIKSIDINNDRQMAFSNCCISFSKMMELTSTKLFYEIIYKFHNIIGYVCQNNFNEDN